MPARTRRAAPSVIPPAGKKTGPRTEAGKAVSSRNAWKHGCRSDDAVLPGEDPDEYAQFIDKVVESLAPVGAAEQVLAYLAANELWRLPRTRLWEAARARLLAHADPDKVGARIQETEEEIRMKRSELGAKQMDPEASPPPLVALLTDTDETAVDALDVELLWDEWTDRLPDPEAVPTLEELCDRVGLPEEAASEPADWPGWTAAHLRLLVAEFARVLGMTLKAYLREAEVTWRAGLADERARRKRRRSELRKEIAVLEQRIADLIVDRAAPDGLRLDLLARYGATAQRAFDKALKSLMALQEVRRRLPANCE